MLKSFVIWQTFLVGEVASLQVQDIKATFSSPPWCLQVNYYKMSCDPCSLSACPVSSVLVYECTGSRGVLIACNCLQSHGKGELLRV